MTRFSSSINTLMLSQRLHIEGMRHGTGFGSGAMRMSHEANIGGSRLRINVVRIDEQLPGASGIRLESMCMGCGSGSLSG